MESPLLGVVPVDRMTGFVDSLLSIAATLAQSHLAALSPLTLEEHRACALKCSTVHCVRHCTNLDKTLENKAGGLLASVLIFCVVAIEWRDHAMTLLGVERVPRRTILVDLFLWLPAVGVLPLVASITSAFYTVPEGVIALFYTFLLLSFTRSLHLVSLGHVRGSGAQIKACRALNLGTEQNVPLQAARYAVWALAIAEFLADAIGVLVASIVAYHGNTPAACFIALGIFTVWYRLRIFVAQRSAACFCQRRIAATVSGDLNRDTDLTPTDIWENARRYAAGHAISRGERSMRGHMELPTSRVAAFADGVYSIVATSVILAIDPPKNHEVIYNRREHELHSPGGGREEMMAYVKLWRPTMVAAGLCMILVFSLWCVHAQILSLAGANAHLAGRGGGFVAHTLLLALLGLLPFTFTLITSLPQHPMGQIILGALTIVIALCYALVLSAVLFARRNAPPPETSNSLNEVLLPPEPESPKQRRWGQGGANSPVQRAATFIIVRLVFLVLAGIALVLLGLHDVASSQITLIVLGPACSLLVLSHGIHAATKK